MSSARHHADIVLCRRQPGKVTAKLCNLCEGRCVLCDSYVRPAAPVRLCSLCAHSSNTRPSPSATLKSSHEEDDHVDFDDDMNRGSLSFFYSEGGDVRCLICDKMGAREEAFYCRECVVLEKDRDGCPKAVNLSAAKLDLWYERRRARAPPQLLQDLTKNS